MKFVPINRFRFMGAGWFFFGLAALLSSIAYSQLSGPSDSKGTTTKSLGSIDLTKEIEDISGRSLRARAFTIEPGGHGGVHSHKGRPTLEYVLQGNVVEIRNGVEIPHGPGELVLGTGDVNHWWENRSNAPVVLLPIDVYKQ
jgi:quercetin dioxygenase-like cupin family protein